MADTPLDLASLPCPQGGNWRIGQLDEPVLCFGKAICGSIIFDNEGKGGWDAYDVDDATIENGLESASRAADVLIAALGLTPAPAADLDAQLAAMSEEARAAFAAKYGWDKAAPHGRTFTEAEVRKLLAGSWDEGFLQGIKTQRTDWKGGISMGEIRDAVVDAAIAAATDAGKDEPR